MAHVRKQIREAAAAALRGLATTGDRVYETRVYPVQDNNLPGISVYTNRQETSIVSTTGSGAARYAHELELIIEAYAKASNNLEDIIDKISVEVEEALKADTALRALTKWIIPAGFELNISGEAEKPVGIATMTFNVRYETLDTDPETAA